MNIFLHAKKAVPFTTDTRDPRDQCLPPSTMWESPVGKSAVTRMPCCYFFAHIFQDIPRKISKGPPKKNWNKYFAASFWKNISWKKQYFSLATFLCKILGVSSRLACFFCPLFLQNVLFIRSLRSSLSFTNSSPRRPWVPHVSAFETKSGKGSGVFWDMKKQQKKRYVFLFCQIILKYYMIDMIWSYSYRICKWYISW